MSSKTPLLDTLRERRLLKLWKRWRARGGIIGFLERQERMSEILKLTNQAGLARKEKAKHPSLRYVV